MFTKIRIVRVWRLLLVLVASAIIGWILWQYFGVDGTFSLTYQFDNRPNYISRFTPIGRALDREQNTTNDEYYQRIIGDPVYFTVKLPSPYPKMSVTIEYQNAAQNIVQLGLRLSDEDTTIAGYSFQPLENKFVDDSSLFRSENAQYVLLQRAETYNSVNEFFKKPPAGENVGTFLFDKELPFVDSDYQITAARIDLTVPLRGRHELTTYIKGEPLDFVFTYEDINYAEGVDSFTIDIERLGEVIATQMIDDDGIDGITGTSNGARTVSVQLANLEEGVYDIVLNANDDIVFTEIHSTQDVLVFKRTLHLAGTEEYKKTIPTINTAPTTIFSDGGLITGQAKHIYGVQDVEFYNTILAINRVDIPFLWRNPVPRYFFDVTFPNNDVYLTTDTAFALTKEQWFDPDFGFRTLTQYTDLSQLEYIISKKYDEPTRVRSWTTATATFDLATVDRADPTTIDFMLSAPGLETATGGIKVRKISIVAEKEPLTWSNLWPRLTKKFF